jgi:6,7-dimethyl-8-ribityllumazine synthase
MPVIHAKEARIAFNAGVVVSRFNEEVTLRLLDGALTRFRELGFAEDSVHVVWVPGAVEIPIIAQSMAESGKFDAILCLGAVIRGETGHYDHVCNQVSYGCQKVALQYDVPVLFGVLTTDDEAQALARSGGAHGNKGAESVDAAMEMIVVRKLLSESLR